MSRQAAHEGPWYHGTGRPGGFEPGQELTEEDAQAVPHADARGMGQIWITPSPAAAAYHARNNAMGRYDYFGQGDAHPRVYEMEHLEGLDPKETGARVKRARVKREVEFKLPNGKGYEQDKGYYPWGGGEAKYKPAVLSHFEAAAEDPESHGHKERWQPGERAHFEYHCLEDHCSNDAELWYRSHQQATVTGQQPRSDTGGWEGSTFTERADEAAPDVYHIRFDDGHEGDAFQDELMTHPKHFFRPDPPARPKQAAAQSGLEYHHLLQGRKMAHPFQSVMAEDGGTVVGHLSWGPGNPDVQSLWVHPDYRHRGIATALWGHAQALDSPPQHSLDRSDAGDAWARSVTPGVPDRKYSTSAGEELERRGQASANILTGRLQKGDDRHIQRIAARPRIPRGNEACGCCGGTGEHADGHECYRCDASGYVENGSREPYCPGQNEPKRRHWREAETFGSEHDESGWHSREAMAEDTSYRGRWTAPGGPDDDVAAPMHDVENVLPDAYDKPHLYTHEPRRDADAIRQLRRARGNPEAEVDIYRAVPHGVTSINKGDWVSNSAGYARMHAESEGHPDVWPVLHAKAKAKHLFSEGYLTEWGYHGPDIERAEIHHPGQRAKEAAMSPESGRKKAAKVQDGDERAFESPRGGSYTMRYREEDHGERKPRRVIESFTPSGAMVGELNWMGTTGVIHHLNVAGEEDEGEERESRGGEDPTGAWGDGQNHRRKGLATAMWNWGREIHPKLRHSGDQTPQGEAWARSVGGPGLRARQKAKADQAAFSESFRSLGAAGWTSEMDDRGSNDACPDCGSTRFLWKGSTSKKCSGCGMVYGPDLQRNPPAAFHEQELPEVVAHFGEDMPADPEIPYMKPPGTGAETTDHILQYHTGLDRGHPTNLSREDVGLHGDDKHWQRWHAAEHRHRVHQDHQHLGPVGTPGEKHWPDTFALHETYLWPMSDRPAGWHPETLKGFHPLAPAEGALLQHFGEGSHPKGISHEELDARLEGWFHPQKLEADKVRHPVSGWDINTGEERRVTRPPEGPDGPHGLGPEGPATFDIIHHPGLDRSQGMFERKTGTEPVQHVYRGVSAEEWAQAQQRGYLSSDQRGTISPAEGTNAAVDPRSAVSYLPGQGAGHVVKIRVHPDEHWFTIRSDNYLRTRRPIPLSRVEGVSPQITKGGKYNWITDISSEQHTAAVTVLAALENPLTGHSEWFHGTQAPRAELAKGFHDPAWTDPEADETPEAQGGGTWSRVLGSHFAAGHDVARAFAEGEHSSSHNDWNDRGEPAVVHAHLQIRNPKVYKSEFDLDSDAYEHAWKAGNHPSSHLSGNPEDDEEMWPSVTHLHEIYGNRKIPKDVRSGVEGHLGAISEYPDRTEWLNGHPDRHNIAMTFKKHLEAQGHDGVVYGNEYEHSEEDHPHADTAAIAFHPHQIQVTKHHDAYDETPEPELGGRMAVLQEQGWPDQPEPGARFFHGRNGTYPAKPGDVLTPQPGGMRHMYYTTHLPTADRAAGYGQPIGENGRPDLAADAVPGHVYEVVPQTPGGKRVSRHALDPDSGLPGAEQSWRTKGGLRVLHEVDRHTGEPLEGTEHTAAADDDREPVDLYRGLYFGQGSAEDADKLHRHPEQHLQGKGGLGVHWTRSPDSAYNFATDRDPDGWAHEGDEENEGGVHGLGMILHARVHPRHIVEPGTPEWEGYQAFSAVLDPEHAEQETTVRDGAPVRLHKIYTISEHEGNQRETEHPQGRDHVASVTAEPGGGLVNHFAAAAGKPAQLKMFHWPHQRQPCPECGYKLGGDEEDQLKHIRHVTDDYEPAICEHCGGDENLPREHAEKHHDWLTSQDWYTDWNEEGPGDTIHRGFGADLPDEVHRVVHDQSLPVKHRANVLMKHLLSPGNVGGAGVGNFWSGEPDVSKTYAESYRRRFGQQNEMTPVMLHAHTPDREHFETDPDTLQDWGVYSYHNAGNREVPLQNQAPVRIKGVSWAPPGHRDREHSEWEDQGKPGLHHLDQDPAWVHHEVGGDGIRAHATVIDAEAQARTDADLVAHFAAAGDWQETDEHGTYDDETGLRHHPEKGWWCHGCQAHHDSAEEVEEHDTAHTDWDEVYPQISQQSLHRGISVHLPQHLHEAVHDSSRPVAERARLLSDHLATTNYGTSWSTNPGRADHYAYVSEAGPGATHVIMRAHMVPRESIETDPDELGDRRVIGYDKHEDQEVPLRRGAAVNVHTIEWRRAPDRDGSGREPFTSHSFGDRQTHLAAGEHHTAAGQYIPAPEGGGRMWQHLQEAHGVTAQGKAPGESFMSGLHDRFHAGQVADRRLVVHHHEAPAPGAPDQDSFISHFFTPAPAAPKPAYKPEPERLDDNEYSIGDVSRRYDWEGFSGHEIEHLVHDPERATFTREDVPVHSLRQWAPGGKLKKPITYKGIARQGKDERDRLDEVERGMDQGATPPIVVVRDGEHHIIADGSHRSAIAAERGHSHIEAFVTDRTKRDGEHTAAGPAGTSFAWEHESYGPEGGYVTKHDTVEGPFYHGGRANLRPGGMIKPGQKPNSWGDTFDARGRSVHTYFAHEPETAAAYARETGGHMYEVEPTGKVTYDGSGGDGSWKSEHPLRVIRKIPPGEWDSLPSGRIRHEASAQMVVADKVADGALPAPAPPSDVAAFWGTESDPEPRGLVEGLPGFFQAAAASLDALAASFEESPAELLVPYITKMADACRNAEQDAAEIAGRLPAAPEGAWTPSPEPGPKA